MSLHHLGRGKQVSFGKTPTRNLSSPRHDPPLSLARLDNLATSLVHASLAPSTHRGYKTSNKSWFLFLRTYSLPPTPSVYSLRLYAAFLTQRGISHPDKFFSALAYLFGGLSSWEAIRSHPDVVRAIAGGGRVNAQPIKRSPPLLPGELSEFFFFTFASPPSHDSLLALTIAVVGFGALMRLGELVEPSDSEDRDPRKYIKRSSARLVGDAEFHFHLPYHKADRSWRGSQVVIVAENSPPAFNFVKLIRLFLLSRDRVQPRNPYLFVRADGTLPPRDWFLQHLRRHAPTVSGHGLRAGGATYLASIGTAPDFIKRMGRWSSDGSWQDYLRDQPALAATLNRLHLAERRR